jgi:hypothetical protein
MRIRLLLLGVLVAMARPALADQGLPVPWIRLERTGCYGFCPVFTLLVSQDGRLNYRGERYVIQRGSRRRMLPPAALAKLQKAIDEARFSELDAHCCDCRTMTDRAWTLFEITTDHDTKTIRRYHGCFVDTAGRLVGLESAILEITGADKWVGSDDERSRQKWPRSPR